MSTIREYRIRCDTPDEFLKAKQALHTVGQPVFNPGSNTYAQTSDHCFLVYDSIDGCWAGHSASMSSIETLPEISAKEFLQ